MTDPEWVLSSWRPFNEAAGLRARLEKAKRERDAAVDLLKQFLGWADGFHTLDGRPCDMDDPANELQRKARRLLESLSSAGKGAVSPARTEGEGTQERGNALSAPQAEDTPGREKPPRTEGGG